MNRIETWGLGLWGLFAFFFLVAPCFGEPFLISDPYQKTDDQPTEFRIISESVNVTVPADKHTNGTVKLRYDLGGLPDGEHVLQIIAVDKVKGRESEPTVMKVMKRGKDVTILPMPSPSIEPPSKQRPPSRSIPGLIK
jgi:hypothetical protein